MFNALAAQDMFFEGVVISSVDFKPVQKASVKVKNTLQGVQTDSLGRFVVKTTKPNMSLEISCIGFKKQIVFLSNDQFLVIKLIFEENDLKELLVKPTENPAWEIIRKVRENKNANNPENFDEFQAETYSKTTVDMVAMRPDSSVKKTLPVLFLLENSGMLYQKNKMRREVISRTLNSFPFFIPFNSLSVPDLNPFGFYLPVFNFRLGKPPGMDLEYQNFSFQRLLVNPVSEGSFELYDFELVDTIITNSRPQFLISFKPYKGKEFDGLNGSFEIDTLDFAITDVNAMTYDSLQLSTFSLHQKFQKTDSRWMPTIREMRVDYNQKKFNQAFEITIKNVVYLKNVQSKIEDENIYFDGATKVILPQSDTISKEEFKKYRIVPLDSSEKLTLKPWKIEQNPKKKKVLDYANGLVKVFFNKSVSSKALVFRNYGTSILGIQGFSPGLLIQNNLQGYPRVGVKLGVGYSSSLGTLRYLAEGNFYFTKDRYNGFTVFHKRYLERPGGVEMITPNFTFPKVNRLNIAGDSIYVDDVLKTGFTFSVKPATNLQVQFSGYKEVRTGLSYRIFGIDDNRVALNNTELSLRYARKETFIRNGLMEAVINGYFPVISLNFRKSWSTEHQTFNFWQSNIVLTQQFRFKRIGITTFNFQAGIEEGKIPFTHLFNNLSSGVSFFGTPSGISTTDLVSFGYNKYASLRINHNFGKTLFRSNSKWFQPEFSIGHTFSYSKLNENYKIPGLELKDFSTFYPELSLNVSRIIRFNIRGFGVGIDLFMNYGYLSKEGKNFNIRPSLSPVFN
jgi:hypothetical protein